MVQSNTSEVVESFDNMGLKEELLRGIYAFGFEKPSAIQQRAIVPCCTGRDVIAQAQSGTGKTATFSVSVLQRVDEKVSLGCSKYWECVMEAQMMLLGLNPLQFAHFQDPNVQALVMAPTRELAQQVGWTKEMALDLPVSPSDSVGHARPWRLHGRQVPHVHWRHQRAR